MKKKKEKYSKEKQIEKEKKKQFTYYCDVCNFDVFNSKAKCSKC